MIRKGTIEDAEILCKVEATCFPPNEAATSKEIQERLNVYANHFLLLFEVTFNKTGYRHHCCRLY